MRAVITKAQSFSAVGTRTSSLAFWMPTPSLTRRRFRARRGLHALRLEIAVQLGRGLRPSRLSTVPMLRRGLHALRLGITRVAIISLSSGI